MKADDLTTAQQLIVEIKEYSMLLKAISPKKDLDQKIKIRVDIMDDADIPNWLIYQELVVDMNDDIKQMIVIRLQSKRKEFIAELEAMGVEYER